MDMIELSRIVVDALRAGGPWLSGLAVAAIVTSGATKRSRVRLQLARRGFQHQPRGLWTLWMGGTLIPLLAITSLTSAFTIEAEIRNGPNRMAAGLEASVPTVRAERYWVVEAGTDHFMNGSRVPPALFSESPDIDAHGFTLDLAAIERADGDRRSGLILGSGRPSVVTSPNVADGSLCATARTGRCDLQPGEVVVDRADGYDLGEAIAIRGMPYRVVAYFDRPMSLLNRSVVQAQPLRPTDGQPFGFVVDAANREAVERSVGGAPVQILSAAELSGRNAEFWAGNGTPILMLLILMIAVFGGAAIFAGQRSEHVAGRPALRTLRSIGLGSVEVAGVMLVRAIVHLCVPVPAAAILSLFITTLLNRSVLGFHSEVDAESVLAAVGVATVASAVAVFSSWLVERGQPLVDA